MQQQLALPTEVEFVGREGEGEGVSWSECLHLGLSRIHWDGARRAQGR